MGGEVCELGVIVVVAVHVAVVVVKGAEDVVVAMFVVVCFGCLVGLLMVCLVCLAYLLFLPTRPGSLTVLPIYSAQKHVIECSRYPSPSYVSLSSPS